MMDRRTFLAASVGILGLTALTADAQQTKFPRIGYLGNGSATPPSSQPEAFRRALRELGWVEGQNVTIEYRWAESKPERLPGLIAELIQLKVDIIVLAGVSATRAAQRATTKIPIVFILLTDPVTSGFAQSLARPGGNLTGLASQFEELVTKQLELLKESVPNLSQVALLYYAGNSPAVLTPAETAARRLGLTPRTIAVAGVPEFEDAFKLARNAHVGAIHVLPSAYFNAQRARLIELAARYRLPAFYEFSDYVRDGGLMSYGPNISEMNGRAASYVDRILKGANPGDLPIERPSRFEFVINLKTAKALGIAIPESVLLRADEAIR